MLNVKLFTRKIQNSKGQSLIQVVIAIGMAGVLSLVLLSIQQIMNKQQYQSTLDFQVKQKRLMIEQFINNPISWKYTIAANSGLSCLNSPSTCRTGDTTNVFIVKDTTSPNGNTFYDWSSGGGLNLQGTACPGFINPPAPDHTGNGNSKCPLQFQISWTAECGGPTGTLCGATPILSKINMNLVYNPGPDAIAIPFSTLNYSKTFPQGGDANGAMTCNWQYTAAGLVEVCGRVGIGTTSPTQQLDVAGNANFSGFITPNRVQNINGTDAAPAYSFLNSPATGINSPSNNTMSVVTNSVERMRVTPSGNVGIGSTSPIGNLDVTGSTYMRAPLGSGGYGSSSGQVLKFTTDTGLKLMSFNIESQFPAHSSIVYRNDLKSGYGDNWMMAFRLSGSWPGGSPSGPSNRIEFFGGARNDSTDTIAISHGNLSFQTDCIAGETCTSVFQRNPMPSDSRLKDHIRPFTKGLDTINQVHPVFYQYNGLGGTIKDGKDQLGVIAQELEKQLPELVTKKEMQLHKEDQKLTEIRQVNYIGLIFVVINAVQDLYKKLFSADGVIQQLKNENKNLSVEVKELKAIVCGDHPKAAYCTQK